MSDDRNRVSDKAGEIARNIWLAGVGAYGRAVEDAQGRLEKAMEPPKLFKELVKAGAELEEDARKEPEVTPSARKSVEERIARVRDNFHLQRPARIEDIAALEEKIDRLERKIDALTRALKAQGDAGPKQRPAAKRKSSAGKGSKNTAGKSAASGGKKPAAKRKTTGGRSTARKPDA